MARAWSEVREWLRKKREAANFRTQTDLAEAVDVSESTVRNFERDGEVHPNTRRRILGVIGVDSVEFERWLVGGPEPKQIVPGSAVAQAVASMPSVDEIARAIGRFRLLSERDQDRVAYVLGVGDAAALVEVFSRRLRDGLRAEPDVIAEHPRQTDPPTGSSKSQRGGMPSKH